MLGRACKHIFTEATKIEATKLKIFEKSLISLFSHRCQRSPHPAVKILVDRDSIRDKKTPTTDLQYIWVLYFYSFQSFIYYDFIFKFFMTHISLFLSLYNSLDYRERNESSWYGCGFIEIIRKDNEGRVDDHRSSYNIFTFLCISSMQFKSKCSRRNSEACDEESGTRYGELLQ